MKKLMLLIIPLMFSLNLFVAEANVNLGEYYPADHKGLLPLCNVGEIDPVSGDYLNPCGLDALIAMVNKLINFIIIQLGIPFFSVLFTYAGILYLTSGANPDHKNKAKKILTNSLIGFGIVLGSWLVIKTILVALNYQGVWFLKVNN